MVSGSTWQNHFSSKSPAFVPKLSNRVMELVNKCIGKSVSARPDDVPSLQSWKAKLL